MSQMSDTLEAVDHSPEKRRKKSWFLWGIVAVVVVGGVITALVMSQPKSTTTAATHKKALATTNSTALVAKSSKGTTSKQPVIAVAYKSLTIYFPFNEARLTQQDKDKLKTFASSISNQHGTINIVGYTDNIGTNAYNKQLSILRAQNTKGYLVSLGLKGIKYTVSGLGSSHPVGNNSTSKGRQQNRRSEINFLAN